jgi:hypothetical protein
VTKFTLALKAGIDGIRGTPPDTVVCGSDKTALKIRESLAELGLDMHVIADDELSPNKYWVTSQAALSQIKGGGQN